MSRVQLVLSVDSIHHPLTGIGRYTLELARQLQARTDVQTLYMGAGRLFETLPACPEAAPASRRWLERLPRPAIALGAYRRWVAARHAALLRGHEQRLLHGTNYYLPAFAGRSLVTIHDASVLLHARSHRPDRVRHLREVVARSLRQASLVLTVSEFSRREIAEAWNYPEERIQVTPLAAAADFHPRDAAQIAAELALLGLRPGAYCLYVGTIEPRKNLATLLRAYAGLPLELRRCYPLVLAGHADWPGDPVLARIQQAQAEGWLRYLGFVPARLLPLLQAGARLFAYPSRYEGFGLPILEAMASAVPVVCADAASLPEVAGDAAAYAAPDDCDGWTALLARGLDDAGWRAQAIERGRLRAASFSWARCAALTVAAYAAAQR